MNLRPTTSGGSASAVQSTSPGPHGSDPQLEARIQSYEQAYRMQMEATDALDIMSESASVRERYGDTPQGRQLLMARRLVERGVRFMHFGMASGSPGTTMMPLKKTTVSWLENVREASLPCSPISRSEACWTIPSCCGEENSAAPRR